MSDLESDSSVIVVSDSDDSENESDCLSSSEQQDCPGADDHAAEAVAAVFLNTASTAGHIHSGSDASADRKLPLDHVVNEDTAASSSSLDGNVTETMLIDLTIVTSSVPSSVECATCARQQSVSATHSDLQVALPATEANEEMKVGNCIAAQLANGFDSAVCSELSDFLGPIELLSLDKCETLNDVCNSSFLGDLSFIDECLAKDCASLQMLDCSNADVLRHELATDSQSDEFNKCTSTSEISGSHNVLLPAVERSADLVQMSSDADEDVDDGRCQKLCSHASTANNISVTESVDSCKSASNVDSICKFTSVSASGNVITDEHLTSERAHTACCQSADLDLNANELWKPTVTDTIVSSDQTLSSDMKVTSGNIHSSYNVLTADVGQLENLLSTRTEKRPHADECCHVMCKRRRVNDGELLTVSAGSTNNVCERGTNNSDTTVHSADSCLYRSTHSDGSHLVELRSICCSSCKLLSDVLSMSYCTDGHACCITCLQQQVKSLLSSPSKESFRCMAAGCQKFYNMSRLRSCLPQMVIDVLEDKMEHEYRAGAMSLLSTTKQCAADAEMSDGHAAAAAEETTCTKQCRSAALKIASCVELNGEETADDDDDDDNGDKKTMKQNVNCSVSDLPSHWTRPHNSQDFCLVSVSANTVEYQDIAELFYETMTKLDAEIVDIHRLENPVLWQFYQVQKKQRARDNAELSVSQSTAERTLFHGVKWRHLDSVARSSVDWRTTGFSHGVMFGQGTYFARDASYAHEYTDIKVMEMTSRNNDRGSVSVAAAAAATALGETNRADETTDNVDVDDVDRGELDSMRRLRVMIAARVYVGRYTAGLRTYRKPPPIDPTQPFSATFDACVNYTDEPTLFVVFDSSQCYPEHFITYCCT